MLDLTLSKRPPYLILVGGEINNLNEVIQYIRSEVDLSQFDMKTVLEYFYTDLIVNMWEGLIYSRSHDNLKKIHPFDQLVTDIKRHLIHTFGESSSMLYPHQGIQIHRVILDRVNEFQGLIEIEVSLSGTNLIIACYK